MYNKKSLNPYTHKNDYLDLKVKSYEPVKYETHYHFYEFVQAEPKKPAKREFDWAETMNAVGILCGIALLFIVAYAYTVSSW